MDSFLIRKRIGAAGLFEAVEAEEAGVAKAAADSVFVRIVAGVGEAVVDTQVEAQADDLRFRQFD